jgi:TPR repeat protein
MRSINRVFTVFAVSVCCLGSVNVTAQPSALAYEGKTVAMARQAYFGGRYEEARSIAYKLATEGDPEAQMLMGQMLKEGKARSPNYVEAVKWIRLAADQGQSWAQFDMGLSYQAGKGVPKNYVEAARWFRRGALNGNPAAQDSLGRLYVSGKGVSESFPGAYAWLSLALAQGFEYSKEAVASLEKALTPDQLVLAQKMADECQNTGYTSCEW